MALLLSADLPVQYEEPYVRFREDGRLEFGAAYVKYGFVSVNNLRVVGTLVVESCRVRFVAEEVSPRSFVTATLPTLINEALARYTADYCVEAITVREGEMEIRLRVP